MPKETKELDRLLNTPSEDEEEIDENEENPEKETEENKEETEETEEEENEESEEDKEEGGEKEGEAPKKDRWHGKSREEVIKAHEDIEKKNKELEEKLKGEGGSEEEEEKEEKEEESQEEIELPADEEMAKMTPRKFAIWILDKIDEKVSKTYEEKSAARDAVAKEIREAQKDHPLLKTNPEYRELVLAVIDASASKGKAMPLKEACQKVDAFAGKEKGEEEISEKEKSRLKKAKAQVESGAGAPSSPAKEPSKETKRIQKALEPSGSDSPLGGLGV